MEKKEGHSRLCATPHPQDRTVDQIEGRYKRKIVFLYLLDLIPMLTFTSITLGLIFKRQVDHRSS